MKRLQLFILILLLSSLAFAASISSPAATVKLTENVVISKTDLSNEVAKYKAMGYTNVTESDVLDAIIEEKLIMQGAKRDGYYVDDRNLEVIYSNQKSSIEAQAGQTLTDEQFEQFVIQQVGSVQEYKESLRKQATLQEYVSAKKSDILQNVKQPTDREITNYYRQNQTSFSQAYMVRVSVITFAKSGDEAKDKETLALANDVYNQIKSGKLTFEKGVQIYSTDNASKSKGGDVNWLVDNEISRQAVGDEFVERVIELDVGEIDGVIETPSDYTIAKVTASQDAKILSLTDPIQPDSTVTVKEYIREGLLYQNSQIAYMNAYTSLVNDLKSEAVIKKFI